MQDAMRSMVDDEKKTALEALLKQLYKRMSDEGEDTGSMPKAFAGKESPAEEAMEELVEKEGEEGREMAEGEEMAEEGMGGEIADFMKNRHKPKIGKGVGVMIKVSSSKPGKKAAGRA